jgi:excisionase family DNA binding protein
MMEEEPREDELRTAARAKCGPTGAAAAQPLVGPTSIGRLGLQGDQFGCRLAFSVKEVALILGLSEKSVRRLIYRGLLRSSKALRHLRIPRSEIEKFLERTMLL